MRAVSGAEDHPRAGTASAAANPYYRTSPFAKDHLATRFPFPSFVLLASAQGTDAAAREPFSRRNARQLEGANSLTGAL
jgi:hypothetical protein